jgi:hypothetical protein
MNEELFSERQFLQLNQVSQSELIANHCAEIEEQIRDASSRLEAERISAGACLQFEKDCPSMLVRNALIRRIEELIGKYWDHKK